jgi:hypothetical protein
MSRPHHVDRVEAGTLAARQPRISAACAQTRAAVNAAPVLL